MQTVVRKYIFRLHKKGYSIVLLHAEIKTSDILCGIMIIPSFLMI